jgi:hypothetical protein
VVTLPQAVYVGNAFTRGQLLRGRVVSTCAMWRARLPNKTQRFGFEAVGAAEQSTVAAVRRWRPADGVLSRWRSEEERDEECASPQSTTVS